MEKSKGQVFMDVFLKTLHKSHGYKKLVEQYYQLELLKLRENKHNEEVENNEI